MCCTLLVIRDVYTLFLLFRDLVPIKLSRMISHLQLIVYCLCALLGKCLRITEWINSWCNFWRTNTLTWCARNCVILKGIWFIPTDASFISKVRDQFCLCYILLFYVFMKALTIFLIYPVASQDFTILDKTLLPEFFGSPCIYRAS